MSSSFDEDAIIDFSPTEHRSDSEITCKLLRILLTSKRVD